MKKDRAQVEMQLVGTGCREYGQTKRRDTKVSSSRREIIRKVVTERKRQKLTQRELAEKTGLKQSNISRLETGKSNPSIDFLQRIAEGLGKKLHIDIR